MIIQTATTLIIIMIVIGVVAIETVIKTMMITKQEKNFNYPSYEST